MPQATETIALGAEQVTVVIEFDLNSVWLISGDFSGTIPSGATGHIVGNVDLAGDLIVEGTLTGIDTFTLEGNGFQVLFQNGGRPDLAGKQKTAWSPWGGDSTGWVTGDRLAVAPTKAAVYAPTIITWQGSWAATARPVNSPDVNLVDGSVARPEVANLSQTVVLKNLRRVHFHDGAGVATLKWVKVLDAGQAGVLAQYPIHFHLNGDTSRGSLVEGVVVEGGKNHAFVPHGSHGIDFIGCAAVNTMNDAFWWDPPPQTGDVTINDSNDTNWQRCLALGVKGSPGDGGAVGARLTAFLLGAGSGNKCNNSVAVGVEGFQSSSGYHWPERGIGVWEFNGNAAHNCKFDGIFVWQNSIFTNHLIDGFTATRCGKAGVEHGAYSNFYTYRNLVLTENLWGMFNHALSWQLATVPNEFLEFENIISDTPLRIAKHNNPSTRVTYYRNASFPSAHYGETGNGSVIHYEGQGWVPAKFNLSGGISPNSVIEIKEAGVLTHRWQSGGWS